MTLTDQIYAQARILAGPLECRQEALLRMVCLAAERSLQRKMRPGLSELPQIVRTAQKAPYVGNIQF